jgi:anti-sigma factor RsiW
MDHKEAVATMAVEKYLLDEFREEERDDFENHLFSCYECARDVKLGVALMEHGKEVFSEEPASAAYTEPAMAPSPPLQKPTRVWFAWLRPAFAVPALAFALGVVVFQNAVQIPEMRRSITAMNTAEVLPPALYLASGGARGGDDRTVTAKAGQIFLLTIDIPGDASADYTAELYDSAGQKKLSVAIPETAPKEGLMLSMPGSLEAGTYSLVVRKAAGADSSEVTRSTFVLQRQ